MKLICPNCDAQYLVDDALVPDAGRDVQCSNCGSTWFQQSARALAEAEAAAAREALARAVAVPEPEPDEAVVPDPELTDVPPEPEDEPVGLEEALARRPRRAVDQAVLEVLREEAEREKAAREASRAPQPAPPAAPEVPRPATATPPPIVSPPRPQRSFPADVVQEPATSQPEIEDDDGLEPIPDEALEPEVQAREEQAAVAPVSSRRDRLPDIEEINSTLRASADPSRAEVPEQANAELQAEAKRRSGFRMGFGGTMIVAAVALFAYIHAPGIVATVPVLKGPLDGYVGAVDRGRSWLDQSLRGFAQGSGA